MLNAFSTAKLLFSLSDHRCSHSLEWMEMVPLQHSLYRSLWHANDTCGLTLPAFVSSWFIVLWLTELFNFSQIFVCHKGHRSSAAFLAIGCTRVMILRKNPIDASVIPLLAWKFFCNPSTSPSFVSETRNNNRQIVFWKINNFQCNLQARYLHNLIFNSSYIIKWLSMTSLMTSLKFIDKLQDLLIYKCTKGNFSR